MNPSGSSMRYWPTVGRPSPPGIPGALDVRRRNVGALAECKELEALDEYLALRGAKRPRDLPRKPDLPGRSRQSRD